MSVVDPHGPTKQDTAPSALHLVVPEIVRGEIDRTAFARFVITSMAIDLPHRTMRRIDDIKGIRLEEIEETLGLLRAGGYRPMEPEDRNGPSAHEHGMMRRTDTFGRRAAALTGGALRNGLRGLLGLTRRERTENRNAPTIHWDARRPAAMTRSSAQAGTHAGDRNCCTTVSGMAAATAAGRIVDARTLHHTLDVMTAISLDAIGGHATAVVTCPTPWSAAMVRISGIPSTQLSIVSGMLDPWTVVPVPDDLGRLLPTCLFVDHGTAGRGTWWNDKAPAIVMRPLQLLMTDESLPDAMDTLRILARIEAEHAR